jgi:hypothetical protein
MNLRKAMFWKQQATAASAIPSNAPAPLAADDSRGGPVGLGDVQLAKVISLPRPEGEAVVGESPTQHQFENAAPAPQRLKGLLNAPELEAFFKTNQFGFGRHHGTRYRSLEALDRGLDAIVAEFQHIVAGLAERRQAKVDRLQLVSQEVATLSDAMAGQVNLALEHTQRELAALREQAQLAEQRKGWVLDALNRYRLGFDRGVRDALDFELLGS